MIKKILTLISFAVGLWGLGVMTYLLINKLVSIVVEVLEQFV